MSVMPEFKFLVIGLGSMGKRRVRNLEALGYPNVIGFDVREDRRNESESLGLTVFGDLDAAIAEKPNALIISVPPDLHAQYIQVALRASIPFFTELNLVDDHMPEIIEDSKRKGIVGFPSSTLQFFAGPKKIKEVIDRGVVGKALMWTYHSGQYLPDWHPWENIQDFFVSKRATGGGREVLAIEMSWITAIFGYPKSLMAGVHKVSDLPAEIDDLYMVQLDYPGGVRGQFTGDVISRAPIRHFRLLGSEGVIEWDRNREEIRIFESSTKSWRTETLSPGRPEQSYVNPEEPYIEEISAFIDCLKHGTAPSYTLEDDLRNLRLLVACEESSRRGERIELH